MVNFRDITKYLKDNGIKKKEIANFKKIVKQYPSLNKIKKQLKNCDLSDDCIDLLKIKINEAKLKKRKQKGGSKDCNSMTLKEIKKSKYYKDLPEGLGKSKLKKKALCNEIEKRTKKKSPNTKKVKKAKKDKKAKKMKKSKKDKKSNKSNFT